MNTDIEKYINLLKINTQIYYCKTCTFHSQGKIVIGEGNSSAPIVFVGEAPGKEEAKTGRPFIGRSGKYLRAMMDQNQLTENNVFITSIGKYLPIGGKLLKSQIVHGRIHVRDQLKIIDPKIVILLGSIAVYGVLMMNMSVIRNHGLLLHKERSYFITIHPAAALRFPKFREIIEGDFRKLHQILTKMHIIV